MNASAEFLNPAEAARRLGISAKALRLYERRGLLSPLRSAAGWRAYGPDEMARAAEIAALRALGLSLTQVAGVLDGDAKSLDAVLAAHQATLEDRVRQFTSAVEKVHRLRANLARGQAPTTGDLTRLLEPARATSVGFYLPWPWGGGRFELRDIPPLNYIIGPLGSGKTRLAIHLAENLPGAVFLAMNRTEDGGAATRAKLDADLPLKARVDRTLAWLADDGAEVSNALIILLTELEAEGSPILVIDMVEHELTYATQEAVIAYLRRRETGAPPLFLMTRSSAILVLTALDKNEAIIFCPANHSPPTRVAPYPGAAGYEAVASCLASPDVRARTEGVIAWHPSARRAD